MSKAEQAREIFLKAISDKTRYGIIQCLRGGAKSVNGMVECCALDQTLVSYHLKYLRHRGFVECKRKGKQRIYSLDREVVVPILNGLDKGIKRYQVKIERSKKR